MPKLSVTVITRNESANLAAALESVAWADEIVVVDSESTDDTAAIARRFTDRVVVRPWPGYSRRRTTPRRWPDHDWILSLDADERVTPALADEIRRTLAANPPYSGYRDPARDLAPRPMDPDDRLVSRRSAASVRPPRRAVDRPVRARVGLGRRAASDGSPASCSTTPIANIADHLETIDRYTTLAARQMHESGRRAGLAAIAGHPPLAFLRNYILRGGFRDGVPGFIISALNAYYVFLKFAKLWQLRHIGPAAPHPAESMDGQRGGGSIEPPPEQHARDSRT